MTKDDVRIEILNQARGLLADVKNLSSVESEEILKLLGVLIEAIERNVGTAEAFYRAKKQQRGSYLTARGFTGELHVE